MTTGAEPKAFTHRTERGELRLSVPASTVLLFEYQGFSDESFVPFIERVWAEHFGNASPRQVQVFADTERQTGYTSEFRVGLLPWSKQAMPFTDVWLMLVKSRWIAMGIAFSKVALGPAARHLKVTTKRPTFQSRLDWAVQRSRERS